jgi:hypothetical protein
VLASETRVPAKMTNVIKLVANQAKSEMVRLLFPHYRRAQREDRTLVHSELASSAPPSRHEPGTRLGTSR